MNPALPVVNVGNRQNPSYLPAEACVVLPGQPIGRKLGPDETRAMIEFACRRPKANADSIVGDGKVVLGLNASQNKYLVRIFYTDHAGTMLTQTSRLNTD